jgi:hypothetical protein
MHRCAPLPATVRRRGARHASWLMQLCPRCFRELRASETAWGTGWRARRARATHSRLDGSERSTVRGPAEKVRRFRASGSKNAPRFLATFIASISNRLERCSSITHNHTPASRREFPDGHWPIYSPLIPCAATPPTSLPRAMALSGRPNSPPKAQRLTPSPPDLVSFAPTPFLSEC